MTPDGQTIIFGHGATVNVYTSSGTLLFTIPAPNGTNKTKFGQKVCISDDAQVVSIIDDGTMYIYRDPFTSPEFSVNIPGVQCLSMDATGTNVVVSAGSYSGGATTTSPARKYSYVSGNWVLTREYPDPYDSALAWISMSGDGSTVAFGYPQEGNNFNGIIVIVNSDGSEELSADFPGDSWTGQFLSLSYDGQTLAVKSDTEIKVLKRVV